MLWEHQKYVTDLRAAGWWDGFPTTSLVSGALVLATRDYNPQFPALNSRPQRSGVSAQPLVAGSFQSPKAWLVGATKHL